MTTASPAPNTQRMPSSGTTFMVAGTLAAALGAYLFQLIAGRALGPEEFAPITALWTLQFLVVTTAFLPLEQLTIRRLNIEREATPWALYIGVILIGSVTATVFTAITLDRLFDGEPWYLVITTVLIATYGVFALGRGYLAGHQRYAEYGLSTMAESMFRLALAGVLLAAGVGALGIGWSLVGGALVILAWRPFRGARAREAGVARERDVAALATFVTANAASQTIVASGPLVVAGVGGTATEVSVFFETFLLFRAPLTIAYSLIARVLPPFTRRMEAGDVTAIHRWAWRLGVGGAALAVAGYGVGRLVGDDVVAFLLGEEFRPTPELAALAAAGMTLATIGLFVQQILIAAKLVGRMAGAWILGLAIAAVGVAALDGSASLRVARAFLVGEAAAFVTLTAMVVAIRR